MAHFLGGVCVCGLHSAYIFSGCAHSLAGGITQVESTRGERADTLSKVFERRAALSLQPNTGNKVSNFLFRPRSVGVSPEMYYYSSAVSRVRESERAFFANRLSAEAKVRGNNAGALFIGNAARSLATSRLKRGTTCHAGRLPTAETKLCSPGLVPRVSCAKLQFRFMETAAVLHAN